jgi:hypothetical protein
VRYIRHGTRPEAAEPTRRRWRALAAALALGFVAAGAVASPIEWPAVVIKAPAWPKKSTINVFIQTDPKGQGRDALFKDGVERWKKTLADRGMTLNVAIGDPPQGTANVVSFTWQADGFEAEGKKLEAGKNDALSGPSAFFQENEKGQLSADTIDGGNGAIRNALPADTDAAKEFLRNLGEHEITHILGLADDDAGSVTRHLQPNTARSLAQDGKQQLNDQDTKEINGVLATAGSGGAHGAFAEVARAIVVDGGGGGDGEVAPLQIGGSGGRFDYLFSFRPANPTPVDGDPEHVALINFGIEPALVVGAIVPSGWLLFVPGATVGPDEPFFADGYMVDVAPNIPPWDADHPMNYLAARTTIADAALGLDNPFLRFTILTVVDAAEGMVPVWAGGDIQFVSGPVVVPAPATAVLLLAAGFAVVVAARVRRRLPRETIAAASR